MQISYLELTSHTCEKLSDAKSQSNDDPIRMMAASPVVEDPKSKSHEPKTLIKEMAQICCSPKPTTSSSTKEESLSNNDSIFESNPFEDKGRKPVGNDRQKNGVQTNDQHDTKREVINLFDQLGSSFFNHLDSHQQPQSHQKTESRASFKGPRGQDQGSIIFHQSPPLAPNNDMPTGLFPRRRFLSTMQDMSQLRPDLQNMPRFGEKQIKNLDGISGSNVSTMFSQLSVSDQKNNGFDCSSKKSGRVYNNDRVLSKVQEIWSSMQVVNQTLISDEEHTQSDYANTTYPIMKVGAPVTTSVCIQNQIQIQNDGIDQQLSALMPQNNAVSRVEAIANLISNVFQKDIGHQSAFMNSEVATSSGLIQHRISYGKSASHQPKSSGFVCNYVNEDADEEALSHLAPIIDEL